MFKATIFAAAFGFAASLIMALALPAGARATTTPAVTVHGRVAAVAPDSLTLLWRLDLADEWHVYGPYRNDTGFPPSIALELPPGWNAEPPRWPAPERSVTAGEILDHVYHHALVLVQTVHRPSQATEREIPARIAWLACRDICVPGDTTLVVPIPDRARPDAAGALADALAAVPRPFLPDQVRIERADDAVAITVPGADALTAIPGVAGPFLADLLADGQVTGDTVRLRLRPGSPSPAPLEILLIVDHKHAPGTTGSIVIQ